MGGVDLSDMFIALYGTPMRSRRWYLPICGCMFDIYLSNEWLLHRRHTSANGEKPIRLRQVRIVVSEALMYVNHKKKGRRTKEDVEPQPSKRIHAAGHPLKEVQLDAVDHFPVIVSKGRCRRCVGGQTSIMCSKCQMRLCIVPGSMPRNCFKDYHAK